MLFYACISHIYAYLCTRNKQSTKLLKNSQIEKQKGLVAQLNSASDYGSEGYWFESSRGHKLKSPFAKANGLFFMFFRD